VHLIYFEKSISLLEAAGNLKPVASIYGNMGNYLYGSGRLLPSGMIGYMRSLKAHEKKWLTEGVWQLN